MDTSTLIFLGVILAAILLVFDVVLSKKNKKIFALEKEDLHRRIILATESFKGTPYEKNIGRMCAELMNAVSSSETPKQLRLLIKPVNFAEETAQVLTASPENKTTPTQQ